MQTVPTEVVFAPLLRWPSVMTVTPWPPLASLCPLIPSFWD